MRFLHWATRMLLVYLAFVAVSALAPMWVYGLGTVQGQMVVMFSVFAGVPGSFKLARSF